MSKSIKIELLSGLKWVAMGRILTQLISWSMTFFVLRLLSPSDYGLVALSGAITVLFGLIAEFGFAAAITQARVIEKNQLASLFGFALLLNIGFTLLLVITAPLIASFYSEERLSLIIQVASGQFVISALGILPDAHLRRAMRFRELTKIDFLSGIFAGVLTLAFAYNGWGYWSLVLSPLFGSALRTLLLHLHNRAWVWPSLSLEPVRSLVQFGGLTMMGRIIGHFSSQMDVLIAGAFLGRDALGVYSVAMQLASMPLSKTMGVINQVTSPAISRMNHDGTISGNGLLLGGKLVAYLLFPVAWGLAAVAPFVVSILMGEKWAEAILPLQLVCLALPLRAVCTLLTTAVSAVGRADIDLKNTLTGLFILPVCLLAGVQYGVIGLSLAWLFAIPVITFFIVRRAREILGFSFKDLISTLAGPFFTSLVMLITVTFYTWTVREHSGSILYFICATLLGILSYLLVFFLLDRKSLIQFLQLITQKPFSNSSSI
jgi:teichuronic acid exporter